MRPVLDVGNIQSQGSCSGTPECLMEGYAAKTLACM